jgi:hypothetical protein
MLAYTSRIWISLHTGSRAKALRFDAAFPGPELLGHAQFFAGLMPTTSGFRVLVYTPTQMNKDAPKPMLLESHEFALVEKLWDIGLDCWEKNRKPTADEWRTTFGSR